MALLRNQRSKVVWTAAIVVAVLMPFWLNAPQLTTACFIMISAIGAIGLNVLLGYTGQISLGHAFFIAVGAYTGAELGGNHHWSALLWIPAAGVIAAFFGALVGPTALRLKGLYLAIVTLGLLFIGQHLFFNLDKVTGGPAGRAFPSIKLGGFDFSPGQQLKVGGAVIDHNGLYYYLALFIVLLSTWFVHNLVNSRTGRAMQAVRERELAGAVLGIDIARTKIVAFAFSSGLAGLSGALYGSFLGYAEPSQWDLLYSITFLAAIIVGGLGTVYGPILGSIVVFAIPDVAKSFPFVSDSGTGLSPVNFSSMLYGVLIIGFFVFEPRGVAGLGPRLATWRAKRSASPHPAVAQSINPQEEAGTR